MAMRHHDKVGAYGRFGDRRQGVGREENSRSTADGFGKQLRAGIDPSEAERQFHQDTCQRLADVTGAIEPDRGELIVEALHESRLAIGVMSEYWQRTRAW